MSARAGQTMTIDTSFTVGKAILVVWGANGDVLLSDHAEVSSFHGALPVTQDYNIQVEGSPTSITTYQDDRLRFRMHLRRRYSCDAEFESHFSDAVIF